MTQLLLERTDAFLKIDASVRSQIKKAVSLYIEYKFDTIARHHANPNL